MKMKQWLAATAVGAMMLSITACGETSAVDADSASPKKTVGVILKTLNSEYWNCMVAGIRQAEADLGVQVVLQGPSSETAFDEQLSMIETMLSAGEVQALVLAPLQPDTAAMAVEDAKIPILSVDTTFPAEKLVSYIGISNENATYEGGKYIGNKLGTGAKVIILAGVQGDLTSEDRIAGWKKGIEETGGEILSVQYTDAATDKAVATMESMMQLYAAGEIDAVVCHSDDVAMGAANAISQSNRNEIIVCGFGGISGAQPVKDGTIAASVDIGPYTMGYAAVEKAVDAIDNKPIESFIDTGATVLDSENIDAFLVKLAEWTK